MTKYEIIKRRYEAMDIHQDAISIVVQPETWLAIEKFRPHQKWRLGDIVVLDMPKERELLAYGSYLDWKVDNFAEHAYKCAQRA